MTKTIGILGGMGSFATLHFFKTLLELSKPDEFRIVIDNAVHILERTKAVKEKREEEVFEGITRSLLGLNGMKADFVVAPCNQAHYWHDRIVDMFALPWLNMIEIVSDTVSKKGLNHPLILGGYVTVTKKLYSEYLPNAVYLPKKENEKIYQAIVAIKKYRVLRYNAKAVIERVIADHADKCDSVIFACTELPIAFNLPAWKDDFMLGNLPIIDSSLELAKAAIKYARGE